MVVLARMTVLEKHVPKALYPYTARGTLKEEEEEGQQEKIRPRARPELCALQDRWFF